MPTWVSDILAIITGVFTNLLTNLPAAIVGFFDGLFLTSAGQLTPLAAITFVFIGIGFVSFVVGWVRSKL